MCVYYSTLLYKYLLHLFCCKTVRFLSLEPSMTQISNKLQINLKLIMNFALLDKVKCFIFIVYSGSINNNKTQIDRWIYVYINIIHIDRQIYKYKDGQLLVVYYLWALLPQALHTIVLPNIFRINIKKEKIYIFM